MISNSASFLLSRVTGEVNVGRCINSDVSGRANGFGHLYFLRGGIGVFGRIFPKVRVRGFCASSVGSGTVVSVTSGICFIGGGGVAGVGWTTCVGRFTGVDFDYCYTSLELPTIYTILGSTVGVLRPGNGRGVG